MRTECNQATFEFHGLFQRKVKARFDGGKITSDAGVLLLREVEKRTGLIAGLEQCFTDHRDPRLIEHSVKELLGQRIYGLCLGYEDLNDHDQLRTDPMLAVAVEKADPLGKNRRQAGDRGKALAGKCTLNRLELTAEQVDGQERYKKIAMDGDKIDRWMVDAFIAAHESEPSEIVLDLDATDDTIHGNQEGRFFHGYYGNYASLREVGFASVVNLLGTYSGQSGDLSGWLEGAPINRDRNLRLQYLAGMGLNLYQADSIFRNMVAGGVRFPEQLFAGPAVSLEELERIVRLRVGP